MGCGQGGGEGQGGVVGGVVEASRRCRRCRSCGLRGRGGGHVGGARSWASIGVDGVRAGEGGAVGWVGGVGREGGFVRLQGSGGVGAEEVVVGGHAEGGGEALHRRLVVAGRHARAGGQACNEFPRQGSGVSGFDVRQDFKCAEAHGAQPMVHATTGPSSGETVDVYEDIAKKGSVVVDVDTIGPQRVTREATVGQSLLNVN